MRPSRTHTRPWHASLEWWPRQRHVATCMGSIKLPSFLHNDTCTHTRRLHSYIHLSLSLQADWVIVWIWFNKALLYYAEGGNGGLGIVWSHRKQALIAPVQGKTRHAWRNEGWTGCIPIHCWRACRMRAVTGLVLKGPRAGARLPSGVKAC